MKKGTNQSEQQQTHFHHLPFQLQQQKVFELIYLIQRTILRIMNVNLFLSIFHVRICISSIINQFDEELVKVRKEGRWSENMKKKGEWKTNRFESLIASF